MKAGLKKVRTVTGAIRNADKIVIRFGCAIWPHHDVQLGKSAALDLVAECESHGGFPDRLKAIAYTNNVVELIRGDDPEAQGKGLVVQFGAPYQPAALPDYDQPIPDADA